MSENKYIIAFSGFKTSGKDVTANIVEDYIKSCNIRYKRNCGSDIIHDVTDSVFGTKYDKISEKEAPLDFTRFIFKEKKSYRDLMILSAEGIKTFTCETIWTQRLERDIRAFFKEPTEGIFIVPSVRFKSEVEMLKRIEKLGVKVFHYFISREESFPDWYNYDLNPCEKMDLDIIKKDFEVDKSEYEWLQANINFYNTIENNGTLEDLKKEVLTKIIHPLSEAE